MDPKKIKWLSKWAFMYVAFTVMSLAAVSTSFGEIEVEDFEVYHWVITLGMAYLTSTMYKVKE